MYEELQVERYLVDYERVPITDEKSPKELDFDILVSFHILIFNLNFMISKWTKYLLVWDHESSIFHFIENFMLHLIVEWLKDKKEEFQEEFDFIISWWWIVLLQAFI